MIDPRRRSFLRGAFSTLRDPIVAPARPPWALAEHEFLATCTRCGECTTACPRKLISPGDGGYPVVSFARDGCTLCGDCERACRPRALVRGEGRPAWTWKAVIDGRCLSVRHVECRACADACTAAAISMHPVEGAVPEPKVSAATCTGCGECEARCPALAIRMISPAA